jgi:hypothetical protein
MHGWGNAQVVQLESGDFKESGTMVNSVIVWIHKPEGATDDIPEGWMEENALTEEVLDDLIQEEEFRAEEEVALMSESDEVLTSLEQLSRPYTKELRKLRLRDLVFIPNVRHAHLHGKKGYDPSSIKNYDKDAIVQMVSTFIDNVNGDKPMFDNEPWVYQNPETGKYEVQVGNTRTIALIYGSEYLNEMRKVYTDKQVDKFYHLQDAAWNSALVDFIVVSRPLTNSEKRRENTVRTQQHWLATAMGYAQDCGGRMDMIKMARKEGITFARIDKMITTAEQLLAKAKQLCFNGEILEGPAHKLATFTKKEQKLVMEYIKKNPHITPIRSIRALSNVLTNSFQKLPEDFPMDSFTDVNNMVWPKAEEHKWLVKMEEGMFSSFLTKDVEAADKRFNAWKAAMVKDIQNRFPSAKELDAVPKGMTVTKERECAHAEHYILDGYKHVFGCKSKNCGVHNEVVKTKEEKVQEAKERVEKKTWKLVHYDAYAYMSRNELYKNVHAGPVFRAIVLDTLYDRLSSESKTRVKNKLHSYAENLYSEVEMPNPFSFFACIQQGEALFATLTDCDDWIECYIAMMMIKENPQKRAWVKEVYANIGEEFSQFEQDTTEAEEKAIAKATKVSKQQQHLNFMRYNMAPALMEFWDGDTNNKMHCKGYISLFGKVLPLSFHLQTNEDKVDFSAMNMEMSKDDINLARAVLRAMGFKGVGQIEDDIDALNKAINSHFNEYLPVIRNHEDKAYEQSVKVWTEQWNLYHRILDMAKEIADVYTDEVVNSKNPEFKINQVLNNVAEGVNRAFHESLSSPIGIVKGQFPKMILKKIETDQFFKDEWMAMTERRFGYTTVMHAINHDKPKVPGTEWPKDLDYQVPTIGEQHVVGKTYNDEEE